MAIFEDESGNRYQVTEDGGVRPLEQDNRISLGIAGTPAVTPDFEVPGAIAAGVRNAGSLADRYAQSFKQAFGLETPQEAQQRELDRAAMEEATRATNPVAARIGGNIDIIPSMLPAGRGAQAGLGAVEGAMRPANSISERVVNAVTGAGLAFGGDVAGSAMVGMAARGGAGVKAAMAGAADDVAQGVAQAAEKLGFQLTPGQKLGDPALKLFEEGFKAKPWLRQIYDEAGNANQEQLNRYVADAIGVDSRLLPAGAKLTDDVFAQASRQTGDYYQALEKALPSVDIPEDIAAYALQNADIKNMMKANPKLFTGLAEEGGTVTGKEFIRLRSALNSYAAGHKNSAVADEVYQLVNRLDNRAGKLLGEDEMAQFAKVREQWRNQILLKNLGVVEGGDVRPQILGNRAQQMFGTKWLEGDYAGMQPETAQLVKALKVLRDPAVRPVVGSSGTAERAGMMETIGAFAKAMTTGDVSELKGIPAEVTIGKAYKWLGEENPAALAALVRDPSSWFRDMDKIRAAGSGAARGAGSAGEE